MVSTPSTKRSISLSDRVVGKSDSSSFVRNKTGPFITASTTAGVTAPGSHAVSPTSVGTAAAQTIPQTTAQHARTANSSTTTWDNSPAPQTHRDIPSAEQHIPPTPLKVECLRMLLQHHPQQDRV